MSRGIALGSGQSAGRQCIRARMLLAAMARCHSRLASRTQYRGLVHQMSFTNMFSARLMGLLRSAARRLQPRPAIGVSPGRPRAVYAPTISAHPWQGCYRQ
jgi:hypothetical protein